MGYIPKRVRFDEFPEDGFLGITCREALDLAIDGEIPAYYHIPVGFELEGVSTRSYGDYHGPFAQLPVGKLEYLHAHGQMRFDCKHPFQALGFYGNNFGPKQSDTLLRQAFEQEEYFILFLKDGGHLEMVLPHLIFMREDIEQAASQKIQPHLGNLHPSERRSAGQIIAALAAMAGLDISTPYKADEALRAGAARHGLTLPSSPETVVKFFKASSSGSTEG